MIYIYGLQQSRKLFFKHLGIKPNSHIVSGGLFLVAALLGELERGLHQITCQLFILHIRIEEGEEEEEKRGVTYNKWESESS